MDLKPQRIIVSITDSKSIEWKMSLKNELLTGTSSAFGALALLSDRTLYAEAQKICFELGTIAGAGFFKESRPSLARARSPRAHAHRSRAVQHARRSHAEH